MAVSIAADFLAQFIKDKVLWVWLMETSRGPPGATDKEQKCWRGLSLHLCYPHRRALWTKGAIMRDMCVD